MFSLALLHRSTRLTQYRPSLLWSGRFCNHQWHRQRKWTQMTSQQTWFSLIHRHNSFPLSRRPILNDGSHQRTFSATSIDKNRGGGTVIAPPTKAQLLVLALNNGVPMLGFGFIDNVVMLSMGDLIDMSIGVTFGLSTLSAAAFGQVFSDLSGVLFGGVVKAFANNLGLPVPTLTPAQRSLRIARIASTIGAAIGVVVGCLLGMTTLLFKDTDKANRMKQKRELSHLFDSVISTGMEFLHVEKCSLFIVDQGRQEMWSKVFDGVSSALHREDIDRFSSMAKDHEGGVTFGHGPTMKHEDPTMKHEEGIVIIPLSMGIAGHVATTGQPLHVPDCYQDPRFNPAVDKRTGYRTMNIICAPVLDKHGNVVGVLEAVNKRADTPGGTDEESKYAAFTEADMCMLQLQAGHVAAFLENTKRF